MKVGILRMHGWRRIVQIEMQVRIVAIEQHGVVSLCLGTGNSIAYGFGIVLQGK
jgi:hypothetical protein